MFTTPPESFWNPPTDHPQDPDRVSQLLNLLALATAMGAMVKIKKLEGKGVHEVEGLDEKKDLFNETIKRATGRLLPGAKLVRSGRPMTDILAKIKKKNRRALHSEFFKYRKGNKAVTKALINTNRGTATKAYKKK